MKLQNWVRWTDGHFSNYHVNVSRLGVVLHARLFSALLAGSWVVAQIARALKSKNTEGKFQGVQSFTKPVELYQT